MNEHAVGRRLRGWRIGTQHLILRVRVDHIVEEPAILLEGASAADLLPVGDERAPRLVKGCERVRRQRDMLKPAELLRVACKQHGQPAAQRLLVMPCRTLWHAITEDVLSRCLQLPCSGPKRAVSGRMGKAAVGTVRDGTTRSLVRLRTPPPMPSHRPPRWHSAGR
eukprot:7383325-Prymnesium_polylepis.1